MDKKATVYLVASGSYSDFQIEQIFLEKEVAEDYAKLVQGGVFEYAFFDEEAKEEVS